MDYVPEEAAENHYREPLRYISIRIRNKQGDLSAGGAFLARFGANAAWLRFAVLSFNVLTAMKGLAGPVELLTARPKRLRFLSFNTPGKLVRYARQLALRLPHSLNRFSNWQGAFRLLPG